MDHLNRLAMLLQRLTAGASQTSMRTIKRAQSLLTATVPSITAARVDARAALLRDHIERISIAAGAVVLPEPAVLPFEPHTGDNAAADRFILVLLRQGGDDATRALGLAVARLLEDSERLDRRQRGRVGIGFEAQMELRWLHRIALLPDGIDVLESFERHELTVMRSPDDGRRAIEHDTGKSLSSSAWFEAERFVATLRFVRGKRKTVDGRIRWHVQRSEKHRYLLRHLGHAGYRILSAIDDVKQIPVDAPPSLAGWLAIGDAEHALRSAPEAPLSRADHNFEIRTGTPGSTVSLIWSRGGEERTVATLPVGATDAEILSFFRQVARISELGSPRLVTSEERPLHPALLRVAQLLRERSRLHRRLRVRIVYVLSRSEHPLEGIPDVGAAFVVDALQREGVDAEKMHLEPVSFDDRIVELLGADVVGIGVYVHNKNDVASLTQKLREQGYRGRIVLGGPEARDIEHLMLSVRFWDAIIVGEAEHVFGPVLAALDRLNAGDTQEALKHARRLRGVVLRRVDGLVLLCDVATPNRFGVVTCPLPYGWATSGGSRLSMNFTRGCPYTCDFCPNHQGRRTSAGSVDELWRFTVLAVADRAALPPAIEAEVRARANGLLGIKRELPLSVALDLCWRLPLSALELSRLLEPIRNASEPDLWSSPERMDELVGLRVNLTNVWLPRDAVPTPWMAKETWLLAKLGLIASRLYWERAGNLDRARYFADCEPFEIQTSEDNTLVNRERILSYLRKAHGLGFLGRFFRFDPGQNTVIDLMLHGEPDEEYIEALSRGGAFKIALGTDGTSNAVLRQNHKPGYKVCDVLAVNKALAKAGATVANNYILLTPESSLLDAIESFVLFLLLPIPFRDYGGKNINLRVIKEDTTLATDEGLLHDSNATDFDVPLRDPALIGLIERWNLRSSLSKDEFTQIVWRILNVDPDAARELDAMVQRWRNDLDDDREIVALALLLERARERAHGSWVDALRSLWEETRQFAMNREGQTLRTFSDLLRGPGGDGFVEPHRAPVCAKDKDDFDTANAAEPSAETMGRPSVRKVELVPCSVPEVDGKNVVGRRGM